VGVEDGHGDGIVMQFTRVVSLVVDMEIWNASSDGCSFVISYESRSCPGFHGAPGSVASWRSLSQNKGAVQVAGSLFETLAEAWRESSMVDSRFPVQPKTARSGALTSRRLDEAHSARPRDL
jgi:hypothetical protein